MFPEGSVLNFTEVSHARDAPSNMSVFDVGNPTPSHAANKQESQHLVRPVLNRLQITPGRMPTPVNVKTLANYLKGYKTSLFEQLVTGFNQGFRLHFKGPQEGYSANNLSSAAQHPEIVDSKLEKEMQADRIRGPFDHPPIDNLKVSPLGVIPKKQPGEFRMIHHLSFPDGGSVNDFIPPEYCSVHYATVDDAVRMIKYLGKDAVLAKTDVRSAFRIIPVHPSDYHLLGLKWRGKFYVDCCLPMGCASSCKIFEGLSTAMEWVARTKLGIPNMIHILDDFLIIEQSRSACTASLQRFLHFCEDIGVPMAPEKTEGPDQVLTFAGIELDCREHEARLPKDKIEKCLEAIQIFLTRKKVTLKELQSLIGLLNFACSVIIPGRVFIRRLINLTMGVKKPHHYIRLTSETRKDLRLWESFLESFNGKSFFLEQNWSSSHSLCFYTDAAQSCGYGIIFGTQWVYGEWPKAWKEHNICFLEFFPIVVGLILWSNILKNKRVLFWTDNESIVHVINRHTAKDTKLLGLLRTMVLICLRNNILFRARHIKGEKNVLADSLSRLQVDKFKAMSRGMHPTPTLLPAHLLPENWEIR